MEKFRKDGEELIAEYLKSEGISRRDAMKMMGIGAGVATVGATSASAATAAHASNATGKIVIAGGGLAGIATAAKLRRMLKNPDITIIEPNEKSVSYQPGQTLVATGVYKIGDIMYDTKDYMPKGVKWIKDFVTDVDADNNKVMTKSNGEISYDYLVVAAGVTLDFGAIKGLEEVGDVLSLDGSDARRAKSIFGKNGLCSIYFAEGADAMWPQVQQFVNDAKGGKKVKAVLPEPHTPFKCGGAQKKIANLINARLVEQGAPTRANASLDFYTNGGRLFGVPMYHDAIDGQMKARDVNVNYSHKFVEVDPSRKIAVFEKHWKEEAYDDFLEMTIEKTMTERVETDYDLLHVIPPNKAPDAFAKSSIGSGAGWIPVDQYTLQHLRYENVFSLGDIAAVPLGKTGGSTRKQYNTLCDNLVAHMEGKEMKAKYDGYTVCPLITDLGRVMMAEFKWNPDGPGAVIAPSFPLAPDKERWIYWLMKVYMLKPMTVHGMLSGRA